MARPQGDEFVWFPIVHRGLAYFVNAAGVLFCVDAGRGEDVYAERLLESVWATPLAVDDRIYFVGRKGTSTVVRAGRRFERLDENHLIARRWGPRRPPQRTTARPPPLQHSTLSLPLPGSC